MKRVVVKSFAGQFSDLVAGVPIKKRRCTYQEKEVSFFTSCFNFFGRGFTSGLRKEHSSTSLGSTLSTSSAGLSDTIGNPVFEEKKSSSDATNADMRQKNLCLCPNRRNQTIPHHRVLWQLRIAKGSDTTRVNSRENWDLNTTIDAWDEGTDASSVKTSIDGLNITHSAHDEKQLMSPTGMTSPTSVISVMQARKESQNKAFITSPGLHGQQFTRSNEGSSHIFRDCLNKDQTIMIIRGHESSATEVQTPAMEIAPKEVDLRRGRKRAMVCCGVNQFRQQAAATCSFLGL
ncbi:hypothetical protein RYX36_030084 [Vicia faba]